MSTKGNPAARESAMKPYGAMKTNPAGTPSHISPRKAVNGFIHMILTIVCFILYSIWLFVPESYLHRVHISYYPRRYWAFAIPAILTMLFIYYCFASACLFFIATHPLDDGRCVTDVDVRKDMELNCGALTQSAGSVAPWADIPVPVVSTLLFQPWTEQ